MIWITKNRSPYLVWQRAKNLRDFKAENGEEYVVAKTRKAISEGGLIWIYVGVDGNLKKTDSYKIFYSL
tara:strand:- start:2316 stop:2522 length:207 start_codon:yes stop_codon:yes gene_type:complete